MNSIIKVRAAVYYIVHVQLEEERHRKVKCVVKIYGNREVSSLEPLTGLEDPSVNNLCDAGILIKDYPH